MIYTALLIVTHSYVVENKKLEGSCLDHKIILYEL